MALASWAPAAPVEAPRGGEGPSVDERLGGELAFVNRYAETLDVFFPNLRNQEALRAASGAKMQTPLAAQPPGTGKTALGRNLTAVLRRPRESPGAQEEAVARRLLSAWAWRGATLSARSSIARAVADTRDENLVLRTLRVCFPHHTEILQQLKLSEPVIVPLKELPGPESGLRFDGALGLLIFARAKGLDIDDPTTLAEFSAAVPLRGSRGAVKALIHERAGPLLLVLDDVTDLGTASFVPYFEANRRSTPLQNAMVELSLCLQCLHGVPGCFIMCTGRLLWLSAQALVGASSPLMVTPLMLAPLTAGDVREALRDTDGRGSIHSLEHGVGVAPAMLPYLAVQAARVSGGVGRVLQFTLRALQREAVGRLAAASTPSQVDAILRRVQSHLSEVAGLVLRVTWDGPAMASEGDVPLWLQQEGLQRKLLRLFARALLLDAPFDPSLDINLGTVARVKLCDAAVVLGFGYAPAILPTLEEPPARGTGAGGAGVDTGEGFVATPAPLLKLVAGDWLCSSLLHDPRIAGDAALLGTAQLLDTMRTFGGTMRGRPFELLCVDALCARSLVNPDARLWQLVAPLCVSMARNAVVPRLAVVAIPQVTRGSPRSETPRLDDDARGQLLLSQSRWTGRPTLHPDDLPWLLSTWLRSGTVAVPADAQSGAQDWFVRLDSAVIGCANKAVGPSNGTAWTDLRDEISRAPTALPPSLTFTLVLLSLHLAAELSAAVGDAEACAFGSGTWRLQGKRLARTDAPDGAGAATAVVKFTVPERMELVVLNPQSPAGGLAGLIGQRTLRSLHAAAADSAAQFLSVPSLVEWMDE